jgi:hypothetical protein
MWRHYHMHLKHRDWGFKITKVEWERLDEYFEQVEKLLGVWHRVSLK